MVWGQSKWRSWLLSSSSPHPIPHRGLAGPNSSCDHCKGLACLLGLPREGQSWCRKRHDGRGSWRWMLARLGPGFLLQVLWLGKLMGAMRPEGPGRGCNLRPCWCGGRVVQIPSFHGAFRDTAVSCVQFGLQIWHAGTQPGVGLVTFFFSREGSAISAWPGGGSRNSGGRPRFGEIMPFPRLATPSQV